MIVTEGVRDTFRKRSKVMSTIRHMLEQQDFLEVETPVLESTAGWVHGCWPYVAFINADTQMLCWWHIKNCLQTKGLLLFRHSLTTCCM